MHLKKIKLAGFKSFVDPTTLDLNSNLLCVVGPNGCGKSNVIDAVRWVMGESSAKNLRGESLADVIFNGSSARKPVGQASIELVFDNTDGTIGGEYSSFNEIAVKRLANRDGTSNYYINGVKCRRRDITHIFLGTGLGPRSYAIIEQGTISRFVEAKPDELRFYIEDAAGISKYKDRRRETENKIRHTRENLERLNDIIDTHAKQLAKLQRQSENAAKYKEYKAYEHDLSAKLHALKWQDLDNTTKAANSQLLQQNVELERLLKDRTSLESAITELKLVHTEKGEEQNTIQQQFYKISNEISNTEQAIKHNEERVNELNQALADHIENLSGFNKQLATDTEARNLLENELATINEAHEKAKAVFAEKRDTYSNLNAQYEAKQESYNDFNREANNISKETEVANTKISSIENALAEASQKIEKLEQELSSITTSGLEEQKERLEKELVLCNQEQEEISTKLKAKNELYTETNKSLDAAIKAYDQNKQQHIKGVGRLESLQTLHLAALGRDNQKLQDFLAQHNLANKERLAEVISIEDGYETALNAVLVDDLSAILVDSFEQVVEIVKDEANINLSFVLTKAPSVKNDNNLDSLLSKITCNYDLAPLLANILVAENLSEAIEKISNTSSNQVIVCKDGTMVGHNFVKLNKINKNADNVFALQSKIEEQVATNSQLQQAIVHDETQIAQLKEKINSLSSETASLNQDNNAVHSNIVKIKAQITSIADKIVYLNTRAGNITAEIAQIKQTNTKRSEEAASLRTLQAANVETMADNETKREFLQTELQDLKHEVSLAQDSQNDAQEDLHATTIQVNNHKTKIEGLSASIKRLEQQNIYLDEKITQSREQLDTLKPQKHELSITLDKLLNDKITIEEALSKANDDLAIANTNLTTDEAKLKEVSKAVDELRLKLEALKLSLEKNTVYLQQQVEAISALNLTIEEAIAKLTEQDILDDITEELSANTKKIERLGAINLAAIEEYDAELERKTYLSQQNEDLEKALSILENAIKKIDKETKIKFEETFNKVNGHLQDLYPRLFGGGRAYLSLTGDDLLEAGVTIMAQPPGKRNSSIHLLSGGEKALTAVAMVFAIFQLNPAPFCMLDEVDAPLDDANVGRYCTLVKEIAKTVQVIYITHNKIAMEMAQELVGVTMKEPGVSRLVSVDVEQAREFAVA